MKILTILVTWNQTDLTRECLAALLDHGVAAESILVVDNGSQPAALPEIARQFPRVQGHWLEQNLGFAGGCNVGVRLAWDQGAEAVLLLNNDALVEEQTIPALQTALLADSRIAAVSPKVYYYGTERVIQSVGVAVDLDSGRARMLGSNEVDHGQYDQPAERMALF